MAKGLLSRLMFAVLIVALLPGAPTPASAATPTPTYTVAPVVTGLTIPWDITFIGDLMLFDERPGRLWTKRPGQAAQQVFLPLPPLFVNSEGGLLGLVADPDAVNNHYF